MIGKPVPHPTSSTRAPGTSDAASARTSGMPISGSRSAAYQSAMRSYSRIARHRSASLRHRLRLELHDDDFAGDDVDRLRGVLAARARAHDMTAHGHAKTPCERTSSALGRIDVVDEDRADRGIAAHPYEARLRFEARELVLHVVAASLRQIGAGRSR